MNTRTTALYKRTERYNRRTPGNLLGAGIAVLFAAAPLGVVLWAGMTVA